MPRPGSVAEKKANRFWGGWVVEGTLSHRRKRHGVLVVVDVQGRRGGETRGEGGTLPHEYGYDTPR